MSKEKHLHAKAEKCSEALMVSAKLSDIISERYFAGILPEPRELSFEELNKITIYNYSKLRKYLGNDIYRVERKTVNVIADTELLSEKSKSHCKYLIKQIIYASQFNKDSFENRVEKFIIDTDYTAEEREFIDLIFNEVSSVASIEDFTRLAFPRELLDFNSLNHNCFHHSAKRVYNDILHKKLRAGDNIMPYLAENLSGFEIVERLNKAEKFDYFFDKDGILKCDLHTNKDILIKNFINTLIYRFNDRSSRIALLLKLHNKYPILISEKNV